MSTLNEWRGDAPAIAQIVDLDPPIISGQVEFYVGARPLGYNDTWAASANTTVQLDNIIRTWNASPLGEFREVTASRGPNGSLRLTAKEAGRPFAVTTTVGGQAISNDTQRITLSNATGGTFTLSFLTETTSAIAYNASAATLQAALEALTAIGSGDVAVSKFGTVWTVQFKGSFAGTDVPALRVNFSGLTGGTCGISVTPIQQGIVPVNCVQLVSLDSTVTGGTATLTWNGGTTSALAFNASAATVQTAVNSAWGSGVVTVTGSTLKAGLTFTFIGDYAGVDVALIAGNGASLTGGTSILTVSTTTGGVAGTNQSNNFKLLADPSIPDGIGRTGFQYYFRVGGWKTGTLSYTDSAATVQAAMLAMVVASGTASGTVPYVGDGNVTVSGTLNGSWVGGASGLTVTLGGRYHSLAVEIDMVYAGGYPDNNAVGRSRAIVAAGAGGTNEVERITQSSTPGTGTFRIVYDGITTDPIEYCAGTSQSDADAWANKVKAALAAHPSIGTTGDMTASYPGAVCKQPYPSPGLYGPKVNVDVIGVAGASPYLTLTFSAAGLQSTNVTQITVTEAATVVSVSRTTTGYAGQAAKQQIDMSGAPWGGTWTLTYSGQATSGMAPQVTAADIRLALESLSNLVPGDVAVSGAYPTWLATFAAALGDVDSMIGNGSTLRNGNVTISTTNQGGQSIVQRLVRRSRGPWHGNDPLNWTLGRVPHNEDIPWFRTGTTGPRYGITWLAEFTVDSADTTLVRCSGDFVDGQAVNVRSSGTLPSGLTGGTTYYVRDWYDSTFRLSASADGSPISLSGGSGTHEVFVQLAGLKSFGSWTPSDAGMGNYVTDRQNGFREYRATYFKSGWATGAKITLHEGVGAGAGMIRIDTDTFEVQVEILGAGGAREQGLPAVLWIGNNDENIIDNYGGSLGIGLLRDEVATLKRYTQRGGRGEIGPGVTFATGHTFDVTGGPILCQATFAGPISIRGL